MRRASRRGFLAAAGSALLAGCSVLDDGAETTVTPYDVTVTETTRQGGDGYGLDGPAPLGGDPVPDGAAAPPAFERERFYQNRRARYPVSLVDTGGGADLLCTVYENRDLTTPELLSIDATGAVTDRATLSDLPDERVITAGRAGTTTVAAGHYTDRDDDGRTWDHTGSWLRGVDDSGFTYDTGEDSGVLLGALARYEDDIVAAGAADVDGSSARGVIARIDPDGQRRWERSVTDSDDPTVLTGVTTTASSIFAFGRTGDTGLLVSFAGDGSERWRRRVPSGDLDIGPLGLAAGPSGVYVLGRAVGVEQRYSVLVALDEAGTGRWQRVFDAGSRLSLRIVGLLDHDGPMLVGYSASRLWRLALAPDGSVRWAGYSGSDPRVRKQPSGLVRDGESTVVYGVVAPESGQPTPDPWLAWH